MHLTPAASMALLGLLTCSGACARSQARLLAPDGPGTPEPEVVVDLPSVFELETTLTIRVVDAEGAQLATTPASVGLGFAMWRKEPRQREATLVPLGSAEVVAFETTPAGTLRARVRGSGRVSLRVLDRERGLHVQTLDLRRGGTEDVVVALGDPLAPGTLSLQVLEEDGTPYERYVGLTVRDRAADVVVFTDPAVRTDDDPRAVPLPPGRYEVTVSQSEFRGCGNAPLLELQRLPTTETVELAAGGQRALAPVLRWGGWLELACPSWDAVGGPPRGEEPEVVRAWPVEHGVHVSLLLRGSGLPIPQRFHPPADDRSPLPYERVVVTPGGTQRTVRPLAPGPYVLTATWPGHAPLRMDVELERGLPTRVTIPTP